MLLLNTSKQTSNGNRVVKGAAIMFVGIKRDFKPAPKVGGVERLLMEDSWKTVVRNEQKPRSQ